MRIKTFLAISTLIASTLPSFSYAKTLVVTNKSDVPIVASLNMLCSNILGEAGIIKPDGSPGNTLTVEQKDINTFCVGTCKIEAFVGKNCASQSIATIYFDNSAKDPEKKLGVVKIESHANGGGYRVVIVGNDGYKVNIVKG